MAISGEEKEIILEYLGAVSDLFEASREMESALMEFDSHDMKMKEDIGKSFLTNNQEEFHELLKKDVEIINKRQIRWENLSKNYVVKANTYLQKESNIVHIVKRSPIALKNINGMSIDTFRQRTREVFNNRLPRECEYCGSTANLHIHHIRYRFPINEVDLLRLCKYCHSQLESKLRKKLVTPETTPSPRVNKIPVTP